jgi:hypothetical protein
MTSRNVIAAVSISVSFFALDLSAVRPAAAEGTFDQSSDIIGLTLHTPKDEIKKHIEDSFVTSGVHDVFAEIHTDLYAVKDNIGYVAEITSKEEAEANRLKLEELKKEYEAKKDAGLGDSPIVLGDGDVSREQIRISFVPGQNADGVTAIGRRREYPQNDRPVKQVMLNSLKAKYGPPTVTDANGVMYWLTNNAVVKNRRLFGLCSLKMDSYSARIGPGDNFVKYSENSDQASANFLNLVNNVNNDPLHTEEVGACGTILAITITPTFDQQYVSELQETLVDFSAAYAGMKIYAKGFWDKANGANQEKLSKDAQKKPAL